MREVGLGAKRKITYVPGAGGLLPTSETASPPAGDAVMLRLGLNAAYERQGHSLAAHVLERADRLPCLPFGGAGAPWSAMYRPHDLDAGNNRIIRLRPARIKESLRGATLATPGKAPDLPLAGALFTPPSGL